MRQHLSDPQLASQCTGMLPSGPAKRHQYVIARVIPTGDRNLANRPNHVGVGNLHETFGQFNGRVLALPVSAGDLATKRLELPFDRPPIEWNGETIRNDSAKEQIDIGDRQRTSTAVARGTGTGACAGGTDNQLDPVKSADAAAAGRHGFDRQHRSDDANSRFFRFELKFITAVETRHVGARASHVEADRPAEAGPLGHSRKTDHSAGRPRQDAVFADETVGIDEAAGGSHQPQITARQ